VPGALLAPLHPDLAQARDAPDERTPALGRHRSQKRAEHSIPLGRICTPEEVANVAVFVASDRASFMNGAIITLDGGQRKALLD